MVDISNSSELFGVKTYSVAKSLGLANTVTKALLIEFIEQCRKVVIGGSILRIYDLITITPKELESEYIPTVGYICKEVSKKMSITENTVLTVVNSYLDDVEKDLLSGRNAVIRRLASFRCIKTLDGGYKVNCLISDSLKCDMSVIGKSGARVSVSSILKNRMGLVS